MRRSLLAVSVLALVGGIVAMLADNGSEDRESREQAPAPTRQPPPAVPVTVVPRQDTPAPDLDRRDAADEAANSEDYLAIPAPYSRLTYRELLTGVTARLADVKQALADPRCRAPAERYSLAPMEECSPEAFTRIGYLMELCRRLEHTDPATRYAEARAVVQSGSARYADQAAWYAARERIQKMYRGNIAAAEQCALHRERLASLPTLTGFVAVDSDDDMEARARLWTYLEHAARLGDPVARREYVDAVELLTAYYAVQEHDKGSPREETWPYLIGRQALAEDFLEDLARQNPVPGLLALSEFETFRIPGNATEHIAEFAETGEWPDAVIVEMHRRAMKYYFAAEALSEEPLRETEHGWLLRKSERVLDVNEIELSRNEGFWLAAQYRD